MGKTQIVDLMAERGLNRKQAATVFDPVLEVVAEAISGEKTVGLPGPGTFAMTATAARQGVKPGTAEKIQISAGKRSGSGWPWI